ncbi:hypothetical protein Daus18300_006616 [Diaporthe australafricana]|uniref:GST N-terminal domain-containing protein n=1 Tax=Diaporthe australafricana TaxID=127596 RepID=A0ABR3WSL9_9PEZI
MASKAAAIKLYTNHRCPWAHRAHITLAELGIPFEEEIIDLDTPRSPEYLKVNPRGLVPSLSYNGEIITESAVVAQFLADAYPSHLIPATSDPNGPLTRARIAFFVDAWFSKVNSFWFKTLFAKTAGEASENAEGLVNGITKEIEPLLKDAGPFFGGSNNLVKDLQEKTPNFHKWSEAVIASPSVTGIFNENDNVVRAKERIAKAKA